MGLLGKADATLATMSYREAMADVAPDLKDVYEAEVANQALFQLGVEAHFDKLYADNNLLADQLKETTTLTMANLGTDYEGMDLFNDELNSMKERMKALPKGKKGDFERAKIRGELAQLKNSTDGMEATQTMLATMIEAGDFDQHATGKVNLSLLNAIASGEAKREIVNGNLFYSITNPAGGDDIKIDQQMLKDMLIQKDPEFQSNFNKIHEGENALGKQKGTKFDRQGAVNKYEASFPSKAAFATNVNNKQANLKYSFKDSLMGKDGSESIYKALMDMGQTTITKYDADGDGDVDAADFANVDNGIILVESLTDIHSEHFDYQTAKKVAAEFYADNISAKEFQDGVNMRVYDKPPKEETGGHTGSSIGGVWVHAETKEEFRGYIDKFEPFQGNFGNWDFHKGQYFDKDLYSKKDPLAKYFTPYEIAQKEGAAKGDPADMFKYTVEDLDENKPLNMEGKPVEGGVYGNFFQQDDDDAMDGLKAMFPTSFTFEETGALGWGRGIEIFHPTLGSLGTYMFRRDAGSEASDEARRFNSNMAKHFTKADHG